jgi:hypothetical protein
MGSVTKYRGRGENMNSVTKHRGQGIPFEPTPEERGIVERAASYGIPKEKIAYLIGINVDTLCKHFADELTTGPVRADMKIGQTLYELATESEDETVRYRACAFWAARRMGWTEKIINMHTGPDDGPVQSINATMTAQEAMEVYQAMLRRA